MTSASVCGSLREHISGTTRPIFANFCACGSVLLWWRCDTSDTSRFMGDVIFARNGLCGNMSIPLQRVTSFHGRAQANVPAALYWLHRVLDDGAHRDSLDESIVQGIPGWSLQCTIALLFWLRVESFAPNLYVLFMLQQRVDVRKDVQRGGGSVFS